MRHMIVSRVTPVLVACLVVTACSGTKGGSAAPSMDAAPKRPAEVTPAAIALGDSIFNNATCQRCHGKDAVGGQNGPKLTTGQWLHGSGSYEDIVKTITTGVPREAIKDPTRRFNMRARGGVQPLLTDDQVKAVAANVWSLSNK